MSELKAPFPYFGGKSMIADKVWAALGQPDHYLEPFFGSGAVLLARPNFSYRLTETVNDKDANLCNVWRALQFAPDEVAKWCDWPVNHADLSARKRELIKNEESLLQNLIADAEWFDAKIAGYWIWCAGCWIGTGMMTPSKDEQIGQRPHLTDDGQGVHAIGKVPFIGHSGRGVIPKESSLIYDWFRKLQERLRRVRVVCGDWSQICGGDWQDGSWQTVGYFFDPPYSDTDRDTTLYHHDSTMVAQDVQRFCLERGKRSNYRIVLTGYDGEHTPLEGAGWTKELWKTSGGYGNTKRSDKQSRGQKNRFREAIWYSPYCIKTNTLFDT